LALAGLVTASAAAAVMRLSQGSAMAADEPIASAAALQQKSGVAVDEL
jgi:hypothetical protein